MNFFKGYLYNLPSDLRDTIPYWFPQDSISYHKDPLDPLVRIDPKNEPFNKGDILEELDEEDDFSHCLVIEYMNRGNMKSIKQYLSSLLDRIEVIGKADAFLVQGNQSIYLAAVVEQDEGCILLNNNPFFDINVLEDYTFLPVWEQLYDPYRQMKEDSLFVWMNDSLFFKVGEVDTKGNGFQEQWKSKIIKLSKNSIHEGREWCVQSVTGPTYIRVFR